AMELSWYLFIWSSICLSSALLLQTYMQNFTKKARKLPPGPPRWPVFGNLFSLGTVPHQTLANLSRRYGPVMWLQLGAVDTVVIQSAKAAKELFKNHDISFAGRTITETMKTCGYHEGSIAVAQYGPYWRMLRRLCTTELVVQKRINETVIVRRKSIDGMIQWIDDDARTKGGVHIARFVFLMTFNLLGNLIFSRDLLGPQSTEGPDFFQSMDGLMKWGGTPNVADFFPILKWLDPQRLRKNMERDMRRVMHIVSGFIEERIQDKQAGEEKKRKDLLDILLEFEGHGEEEPAKISEKNLNIFTLEIFLAATETTSSTTEWAMTELLRHPKVMKKLQAELAQVVGWNRKFEETDIDNLQYLQAVVKETLRLHPPIPFLIPRRAVQDNFFMGYLIPKDTQVLVNVWAIGRDQDSWDDPLSFKPERFLGSDIDYRGQDFEFIPFGAGRRSCVGIPLAHRVLHLTLGSLLHCFEWEFDSTVCPDNMDMKERMGITLRKAVPLIALPKRRNV
ncbi:hypothetical protein GIB67_007505, partial [Kingdonia uniflora]